MRTDPTAGHLGWLRRWVRDTLAYIAVAAGAPIELIGPDQPAVIPCGGDAERAPSREPLSAAESTLWRDIFGEEQDHRPGHGPRSRSARGDRPS